jgi:hypothetical protein
MKKSRLIMLIAIATITSLAGAVQGHHLLAPASLTCPLVDNVIKADWEDVIGATKYSVNIIATYDTGITNDNSDDTTVDLDFGTGDRTDGFAISDSFLDIPLSALSMSFGLDPTLISPYDYQVRVKGLHPGQPDHKRQNNPFFPASSPFCNPNAA